jgi:hypothetical protein
VPNEWHARWLRQHVSGRKSVRSYSKSSSEYVGSPGLGHAQRLQQSLDNFFFCWVKNGYHKSCYSKTLWLTSTIIHLRYREKSGFLCTGLYKFSQADPRSLVHFVPSICQINDQGNIPPAPVTNLNLWLHRAWTSVTDVRERLLKFVNG